MWRRCLCILCHRGVLLRLAYSWAMPAIIVAGKSPVSILYKSIAGRYRPVRVADGPMTARCRFIKNASWE